MTDFYRALVKLGVIIAVVVSIALIDLGVLLLLYPQSMLHILLFCLGSCAILFGVFALGSLLVNLRK